MRLYSVSVTTFVAICGAVISVATMLIPTQSDVAMAAEQNIIPILVAVGTAVSTGFGILWASVKNAHNTTINTMRSYQRDTARRVEDCEKDREKIHERMESQHVQITSMSQQLGRLEERLSK